MAILSWRREQGPVVFDGLSITPKRGWLPVLRLTQDQLAKLFRWRLFLWLFERWMQNQERRYVVVRKDGAREAGEWHTTRRPPSKPAAATVAAKAEPKLPSPPEKPWRMLTGREIYRRDVDYWRRLYERAEQERIYYRSRSWRWNLDEEE